MASRTSTPRSRSRSSTDSSDSSDTTMNDAPPGLAPARPRQASHSNPSASTQAASASADPTFSLLLSLPRELRDRIYSFALTSQYPFWWPNPSPVRHDVAVNLLTASRRIHEETAPILYTANKFLFTHPSDCNIFRVVASPYAEHITSVYFRIREKDLRLWTAYLGSKTVERSLKADLPRLKNLWIFMRCPSLGMPGMLAHLGGPPGPQGMLNLPPAIAVQVQAVQNALGQQVQALQQQVHNLTQSLVGAVGGGGQAGAQQQLQQQQTGAPGLIPGDNGNGNANGHGNGNGNGNQHAPPPPPPPPAMPFVQFAQGGFQQVVHHHPHAHHPHMHPHPLPQPPHTHGPQPTNPPPAAAAGLQSHHQQPQQQQQHHPHALYTSFLRFERELGIESLCLSLQETRPADTDVKIVCILRVPHPEVVRLVRLYPEELTVDRNGDARTRFRKLHGVEVSLEVSGFEVGVGNGVGGGGGGGAN